MNRCETKSITAIAIMAVIFIGVLFSGCATKRDIDEINARIARVEENTIRTQTSVARMDSVITAGAESNRKLQNDIRYSTDELVAQMTQLLENYNDLMTRIDQLNSQQVITLPPKSSPGAQQETPTGGEAETPPPGPKTDTDCIDAYDNAFTLVLSNEYDAAITAFRAFLADCENHENAENAYYWIGECYFSQEQYVQAIEEYDHLLNTYPASPNLGRALYKLARCKQELGKTDEAKKIFERLVNEYAGTLEAEQAANRLKDM